MASLTIDREVPLAPLPAIELDAAAHAAFYRDRHIQLSRREFALLQWLLAHAGEPVSRDRIAQAVWGRTLNTNIVDVYVGYLRRKLGPEAIRTVRGAGYHCGAGACPERSGRVSAGHTPQTGLKLVARQNALAEPLPGMIGDSPAMQRVYQLARAVAPRNVSVLITGASGTGKELVARAIHEMSPRAARPMVTINCAAVPEALLESELFGCIRGAFTGAVQSRLGRIHGAQGGTLFLDEIGELPLAMQSKLLRFLESGELQRLGSPDVFRMDIRVVAASNADLEREARAGSFRDDLFYRLAAFPIALPSLAERSEDVIPLARHFLAICDRDLRFTAAAESHLREREWRGNVRELRHAVERAAILAAPERMVDADHIAL